MKLYAPNSYWESSELEREANNNGCGSELDLSGKLVPNTMYGLNIKKACGIHDWMYIKGVTYGDRLFADGFFLVNLSIIIIQEGGWLTTLRLLRATKYCVAVLVKGSDSFFHGKDRNEDMYITFKGEFKDA
jgi:hypothetical protein